MAEAHTIEQPFHNVSPRVGIKLTEDAQKRAKRDPIMILDILEKAVPGTSRNARVDQLITSVKEGMINELVKSAANLDPDYQPVDFGAWYQIHLGSRDSSGDLATDVGKCPPTIPQDVATLIRHLLALSEVDSAFVLLAGPPPVNAIDDPLNTNQGYLDPAPDGINARYAWTFPGGDGTGIGFVDLEQGWNLNHEDLAAANVTLISGTNTAYFSHGTAVLGEVLMVDNTIGGVGFAPKATGRVISQHQSGGYNTPDAILGAIAVMEFGDVLLLEAQEFDPVSGTYLWPVEIVDATYDAIRLASALGIIVVEAGCNGGQNLDIYKNPKGFEIFNRSSPDFRDSGAIMVGASSYTSPHSRLSFSNYGSRIDVYAWGEQVETTDTDAAGTDNTLYTGGFSGTSSASPIISGAVLLIQGIAQTRAGSSSPLLRFSPFAMRRLLTNDGTASANPTTDLIGVMPDLRGIIDGSFINLAPDIYLRDYVGDIGNTTSGVVSTSPDIIVRQNPVSDPQASFGTGSGTENNNTLSEDILTGHDQSIYVRVLNRGGSDATSVSVTVYYSFPATLVTPNLWTAIGNTVLPTDVPQGNVLTVSNPITWPAASIPSPGHYCFVAIAGNTIDPPPNPATAFPTFDTYVSFVENNNNVAWRNFNIITAPPSVEEGGIRSFHSFTFIIPGAFDTSQVFTVETFGTLPREADSVVELRIPLNLAKQLKVQLQREAQIDREHNSAVISLPPFGRHTIGSDGGGKLDKGSLAKCELRVRVSTATYKKPGIFEFGIRQLYRGREMGRLTWHFGQPDKVAARG